MPIIVGLKIPAVDKQSFWGAFSTSAQNLCDLYEATVILIADGGERHAYEKLKIAGMSTVFADIDGYLGRDVMDTWKSFCYRGSQGDFAIDF